MEDIIQEKLIKNILDPVPLEVIEKITYQMKKCVCQIYINGETGTGVFTKIPYKHKLLKVLITAHHVLGENEIKNNKIITISLNNNEKDKKHIKMNNKRKRYTNDIFDVTIIEIDEIQDNIHDFIELDDEIINSMKLSKMEIIDNFKDIYNNKSIYILNYLNGENIVVSYGLLTEINEENGINHKCNTSKGSSGSPILSLKNNKLIGIHYGGSRNYDYNKGTLIIYPIIEFQKNIKNNNILIIKKEKNDKLNSMTILYNIKDKNRIKLFGSKFIENNKNNCKIIIEKKEQDLIEYLDINQNMKNKEILEIKLKEIKSITNMSYMFGDDELKDCSSISSLPDIDKWDTKNVNNMKGMFYYCSTLSSLPDISKWDTESVTDMSYMFYSCSKLSSLPNISKWDTKNVINMNYMFSYSLSLLSLPDISKWDTKSVTNMSYMFNLCKSLSTLPDISKWDTKNVTDMSYMFNLCKSLLKLPDISKWNTKNVTNMSFMFYGCSSLSSLPDISKWNIKNLTNINSMFSFCTLLTSLPDISKWDIKNISYMNGMFIGCKSLPSSDIPLKFK